MSNIKLTHYAAKGGCACKIGPHVLAKALGGLESSQDPRVLVDMDGADDAGVFRLTDDIALVQTLDFFTPIVDDPILFGKIAAANSLSDVYAMGGTPLTAMNIVAFPVPLVENGVLTDVLKGAGQILKAAGLPVVGGHSIENETPLFGLSITGQVHPERFWRNAGAQVGDALILTKPLGTGIMSTALKGGLFADGSQEAIQSMCTLNALASQVARSFTVHACTDVTGFSLMGHGVEMADGSHVSLHIDSQALPLFTDTVEAARMGLVPVATYGNRKALTEVQGGNIYLNPSLDAVWSDICFDPQTSGGLFFSVPREEADDFLQSLHQEGVLAASCIGQVGLREEYSVYVD